jgi:hypothetical protein
MSTRWQIAAKLGDGTYGGIYVHCDGYPEHALETLQYSYDVQERVDALIALGDCLAVDGNLQQCNPFRATENWEHVKPAIGGSIEEVFAMNHHKDWAYRYAWDGLQWAEWKPKQ